MLGKHEVLELDPLGQKKKELMAKMVILETIIQTDLIIITRRKYTYKLKHNNGRLTIEGQYILK